MVSIRQVDQVDVVRCPPRIELDGPQERRLGLRPADVLRVTVVMVQLAEQVPGLGIVGIALRQHAGRVDLRRIIAHHRQRRPHQPRLPARQVGERVGPDERSQR